MFALKPYRTTRFAARRAVLLALAAAAGIPMLSTPRPSDASAGTHSRAAIGAAPGDAQLYFPLSLRAGSFADLPGAPTAPSPATATSAPTDLPATATAPAPTATSAPTEVPSTSTPTDQPPSPTSTAEPEPTATKPAPLACQQLVTNGDFEAGARSWKLMVTDTEQTLSRAIEHRSRINLAPFEGDWLAWLGGLDQSTFRLTSNRLASYQPADVVSATLSLAIAVVTQETRDRRPNDRVTLFAHSPGRQAIAGATFSEESVAADFSWAPVRVDVTSLVSERRVDALEIEARLDSARPTWFYFDQLALDVCTAAP